MAQDRVAYQGLPCRICWLGLGERDKAGVRFNQLVRDGIVSAPLVIGRDHLDCGSVASPNRETEGMLDGTDDVSDWPLLNFGVNIASGASWVSFHHGGGVGIGFSQHAGQVVVADGTDAAEARLRRVLTNDPMMGIFRHVDSGETIAAECADRLDVPIPMRAGERRMPELLLLNSRLCTVPGAMVRLDEEPPSAIWPSSRTAGCWFATKPSPRWDRVSHRRGSTPTW